MPWKEATVSEKREEFVCLASQAGSHVSALCRQFGIRRKTGYKWRGRTEGAAQESLQDRSRRPLSSPQRTPTVLEEAVLSIRQAHPAWGGRKMAHVLGRDRQLQIAPSTVPTSCTVMG